ncbi:unnamed protein product, partial [Rotaria sp. Silwood1]
IESAEDAFGDEVYYNFLKMNRKSADETGLDEERVQLPQEDVSNKIRTLENRIQIMSDQQARLFEHIDCLMDGLKISRSDSIKISEQQCFDPEESFDESINNIE